MSNKFGERFLSEIEPVEGRVYRFLMREVDKLCEYVPTDHMPSIACVSCAEESYREMGTMTEAIWRDEPCWARMCIEPDVAVLVCTGLVCIGPIGPYLCVQLILYRNCAAAVKLGARL